jgi:hypothetical protein
MRRLAIACSVLCSCTCERDEGLVHPDAGVVELSDACDRLVALENAYLATEDPGPLPTTAPLPAEGGGSGSDAFPAVLPSLLGELSLLVAVLDPSAADLEGIEGCRASLRAYAAASREGAACWGRCTMEAGYARAVDCTERCIRDDAVLERARRGARKEHERPARAWLARAGALETKRVEARSAGLDHALTLELPDGAEPLGPGRWQIERAGAPIVLSIAVDPPRGDFHQSATHGEKSTALRPLREETKGDRHLLARVGGDHDFSRAAGEPAYRDRVLVQLLWDLPDGNRVECRGNITLLDLDDALLGSAIAWIEKICASARFE